VSLIRQLSPSAVTVLDSILLRQHPHLAPPWPAAPVALPRLPAGVTVELGSLQSSCVLEPAGSFIDIGGVDLRWMTQKARSLTNSCVALLHEYNGYSYVNGDRYFRVARQHSCSEASCFLSHQTQSTPLSANSISIKEPRYRVPNFFA